MMVLIAVWIAGRACTYCLCVTVDPSRQKDFGAKELYNTGCGKCVNAQPFSFFIMLQLVGKPDGLTVWTAAVFIMGEMAGSGVLALPLALVHTGILFRSRINGWSVPNLCHKAVILYASIII